MKLKVFFASDGDCFLLSSGDGHHALIDGGRGTSFQKQTWPVLRTMAEDGEEIDLVVVSHIDSDHISGILWLVRSVADWALYDYQTADGGNPDFPPPQNPRPPHIGKLWHNAWRAQLGDLADPIEAFISRLSEALEVTEPDRSKAGVAATDMFHSIQNVAQSIPEGVELRRLVEDDTPIPRNIPFRDLVLLKDPPHVEELGKARLTVIGPATKHLERLREEWRDWLTDITAAGRNVEEALVAALDLGLAASGEALSGPRGDAASLVASLTAAAEVIATTDPSKVSPPNRASITLLAEERERTCLLTGDAAEGEILEGLAAAGRINDGLFRCNVLKVQHHGSEHNLSQDFGRCVIADHYVFSADGAHGNPDPSVVRTIVDSRPDPTPYTVWFTCGPERALASRRQAMRAAIQEAMQAAADHPEIEVAVLDADEPFMEIPV